MAEKPKTKYVESKVVRYSNPLNLTSYTWTYSSCAW